MTMAQASLSEDWIEWTGGECPVAPEALILINVRDEPFMSRAMLDAEAPVRAAGLDWQHIGTGEDIIAYRVVSA